MYILECREELLINILKFVKRGILESDYVMQEKKHRSMPDDPPCTGKTRRERCESYRVIPKNADDKRRTESQRSEKSRMKRERKRTNE